MPEEIITTITQPETDGALEIALIHGEAASPRVELRELVWGAGLGWYRQHTCKLDSRTAHALLQTLGQLCTRLETKESTRERRKVIPFPRSVAVSKVIEKQDARLAPVKDTLERTPREQVRPLVAHSEVTGRHEGQGS